MKPRSQARREPVARGVPQLWAPLVAVVLMAGSAALMFHFFQRQLSGASFAFGTHPEVLEELRASLDDLKQLAELDPENEALYRSRFHALETTVRRLQILAHHRDDLVERYELILLLVLAAIVLLVTSVYAVRQSRHQPRLARLQTALTGLAEGRTDLNLGDGGRDTLGRIAAMIERTSQVMARDRQRLAALQNLSSWQEATRRHAHEMRTPLTGAQLELTRMQDLLQAETGDEENREEIRRAAAGAYQELNRLGKFTQEFTSFARLPQPQLRRQDLADLLEDFVATYGSAWGNLVLYLQVSRGWFAAVDRDMLRQVLVNLCDNGSLARRDGLRPSAADGCAGKDRGQPDAGQVGQTRETDSFHGTDGAAPGRMTFTLGAQNGWICLDVSDDGPGVAEEVRGRLFEPYTTTRTVGQGMGLGLAISKKILLDHGGDLELLSTSEAGSTFRLILPRSQPEGAEISP